MLAQSFAFRGTVNPSRLLPGKATPQKALSGMGWDGHAAGVVPGMALMGIKSWEQNHGERWGPGSQPCLLLAASSWGSWAGGACGGLGAASSTGGTLAGTGPYLFGVVPREDAVPIELLQNILELLGGVWGDKGTVLSMAPLGCLRHPAAGGCRGVYLLDMQFLDPSVPGRGHPCPASTSAFRGQGR